MRIWIDLANSPHVPFFCPLIADFHAAGHEVAVTARDFAQTIELAQSAGLAPVVIGAHGGAGLRGKAEELLGRALRLAGWARGRKFDLAVSHNAYAQILAARLLAVRCATLMDYEHQPANHLAFRLASRVIVPRAFPEASLRKYGASEARVRRYDGIKEDVYLADFAPAPDFDRELRALGIDDDEVLVVARTPAVAALYHRFSNTLFDELLTFLIDDARGVRTKVLLLARTREERARLVERWRDARQIILPERSLDGANLVACADLVVSAGGTMNREAAALGTPAASVYAGEWAGVDEMLVGENRLLRIASRADFDKLTLTKKPQVSRRAGGASVRDAVGRLILETARE